MAGVALCMVVISFYGVAMSGVFSLPWPSLCSARRFITLPCSGQLVCKPTSHPPLPLPSSSYILPNPRRERETSTSLPLCTFTAGIKISWLPKDLLLSGSGARSDLPYKDWTFLIVFQMADAACYFAESQVLNGIIVNPQKEEIIMFAVHCISRQLLFDFPSSV